MDDKASLSRTLANFAATLRLEDVPAGIRERARLHILDSLGIAMASGGYDFAAVTLKALQGLGGSGSHAVIGFSEGLPLRDAVAMNGLLVHGLDYDDTHTASVVHTSAGIFPAAFGLACEHGLDGRDLLAAYIIGVETSARIGAAAGGAFHKAGFHPTGVVNAFGAVLAAGRLTGLSTDQLVDAQGIALSMASGGLEFLSDGAWTKRLHPGWAAMAGVTAAAFAKAGFKGPSQAYEGRFGLFKTYAAGATFDATFFERLGDDWETGKVAIKPFPACHFNHAFIDAALALRDEVDPGAITGITALVPAGIVDVVCEPQAAKHAPQSAYEAQFSLQYAVATALLRGRFTLDELEPPARTDPRAAALAGKVSYILDPDSPYPRYYSGELVIAMTGGREIRHRESINRGADARPLSAADIVEKYRANAGRRFGPDRVERLLAVVMDLEKQPDMAALRQALAAP